MKRDSVAHYWNEYVRGDVHVNRIEGAWGELKRGLHGIYHHASPKHLDAYVQEYAFRYNTRLLKQDERFAFTLGNCEGKLRLKDLIGRKGSRY